MTTKTIEQGLMNQDMTLNVLVNEAITNSVEGLIVPNVGVALVGVDVDDLSRDGVLMLSLFFKLKP